MSRLQANSLLRVIYQDLTQHRGLAVWSVLLLLTSLAVVYMTHLNRELVSERQQLLQVRDELDIEYRHLIIEQTALAEHSRIEQIAMRDLNMQRPDDDQEVLIPWQ